MKETNKAYIFIIFSFLLTMISCDDNTYPRPRGHVRLEYPEAKYSLYDADNINAQFQKSDYAKAEVKRSNWVNLKYPKMKATVHLTHKDIEHDVKNLIDEIQKLTYKHTVKASGIIENPYSNPNNKTYGILYEVTGNAASNLQFYVTDSTKHIVSGALYFYVAPNPDSLAPAVSYIKKDIIALIETLEWQE
ncbi:MAG: gliding motility lipoprotein GldD [Bacteroidota bacterium]